MLENIALRFLFFLVDLYFDSDDCTVAFMALPASSTHHQREYSTKDSSKPITKKVTVVDDTTAPPFATPASATLPPPPPKPALIKGLGIYPLPSPMTLLTNFVRSSLLCSFLCTLTKRNQQSWLSSGNACISLPPGAPDGVAAIVILITVTRTGGSIFVYPISYPNVTLLALEIGTTSTMAILTVGKTSTCIKYTTYLVAVPSSLTVSLGAPLSLLHQCNYSSDLHKFLVAYLAPPGLPGGFRWNVR